MTKVKVELDCLKDLLKSEPIVKIVEELPDKETADLNYIYIIPKEGEGKDKKAYVLRPDRSGFDTIDLTPQFVSVLGEGYITVEKETINENGDVTFTVKTNETLANVLKELENKDKEQDGKLTNLTDRVVALEGKADKDTIYDDTEVKQGIKANESAIQGVESDLTALRTHTDTRIEALESKEDKDTIYDDSELRNKITALEERPQGSSYDDTELKGRVKALEDKPEPTPYNDKPLSDRVTALEEKPDKDTVYNDSDLKEQVNDLGSSVASALHDISEIRVNNEQRLNALESKEYSDKQTLTLEGNTLSISNGNSVELPTAPTAPTAKTIKVSSTSEGVTVTPEEEEGTTNYKVNIDNALSKYYDKSKTYTKNEVDNLIVHQEEKATDITVYKTSFKDKSKVKEGDFDTAVSPRVTLTYSSSTGVGILKVDFKVVSGVPKGFIIAELPSDAPVPAELVESQVWVGNVSTSIWIDKGSRTIRISSTVNPEIFEKRIIISVPGIFKK